MNPSLPATWLGLLLIGSPVPIPTGPMAWACAASRGPLREWLVVFAFVALPLAVATIWLLLVSGASCATLIVIYVAALLASASSFGVATDFVWRRTKLLGHLAWTLVLLLFAAVAGFFNMIIALSAPGLPL